MRLVVGYQGLIESNCSPSWVADLVILAKQSCAPQRVQARLTKLRALVQLHKNRYDAAVAAGANSTINTAVAKKTYEDAVKSYEAADNYRRPESEGECETPGSGDVELGETVELPDIGGGPEQAGADLQWGWIAGNWDIADIGGQIEYRVEADGTLSAYIAATNQRMIDHGYSAGMQIIRGYRMAGADGVTWRAWANGGEIFSAQYPRRGPGDVWGTAQWIDGGSIYLPKDGSSVSFPPLLANRLANFTNPLVRPDTTALDNILAEYNQRTAELEQSGTHVERMRLVRSAIDALGSQSASSADAERAAQMLALLHEREELRSDPELYSALETLEQSSDPAEEAAAWQTLTAHLAASGAHFAQPVLGNDYDDLTAAQMFRVVRYASTLQDDLRDARGALSNRNMSRTTAAMARLQGIASLAGNARSPAAGQMMEGIRNIMTPASGAPGIAAGFEFQSAAVAGLLEQTIAGVGATADTLVDIGAAIGGDRAATARAIAGSRRVESILSIPGYGQSVMRSVGNRVLERLPFARTMSNWFR